MILIFALLVLFAGSCATGSARLMALTVATLLLLWRSAFLRHSADLMTTYVHEAGHGLAALVCRGRWLSFRVAPDASGVALVGGCSLWISAAGYVCPVLLGAMLLLVCERCGPVGLTVVALVLGLLFGLPSVTHAEPGLTRRIGLIVAAVLIGTTFASSPAVVGLALYLVGLTLALRGWYHLVGLVYGVATNRMPSISDANHVAAQLHMPPLAAALVLCGAGTSCMIFAYFGIVL